MLLKQTLLATMLIGMFLFFCPDAWSGPMPEPKLITTSLQRADFVVLARLKSFVPDKTDINNAPLSESDKTVSDLALQAKGKYDFYTEKILKGKYLSSNDLHLHLPIISIYYYNYKFDLPMGSQVLLLLNKTQDNQLVPVDATLPLIPLGSNLVSSLPSKSLASSTVEDLVVSLMLSTLEDPLLRKVNMHLLRSVVNYQMPTKLRSLENDANEDFRDDVLYCLIINQQVQAIPLMAQLSRLRLKETGGAASVGAFEHLKTKEAVPYLNPLLIDISPFTRQTTAFALRKLADKTSIPYLFKALDQPDLQGITLYEVYATLHKVLPRLGTTKTVPAFMEHEDAVLAATRSWWSKHQKEFISETTSEPKKG
jgi:hypothetical protein